MDGIIKDSNDIAIYAEHVSKKYRLGVIGTTTLKADLQTKWALFRGREDPNSIIGTERNVKKGQIYAVDDVSFTVNKGERLGIIGKNGAGKSTLLKLICRITSPTEGFIGHNGKITSMLEVGTGFNGELTARENVYMNGSILGMKKKEVDERFDDIIEFSEVGKFIDTPVKRYSSGMYVRLAFSVSAFLNADIVIMDEVLAVGDVNFQEKCIKRMRDIAEEDGKTVLYVSHNMFTVHALCERCLVLEKGRLIYDGNVSEAEQIYKRDLKALSEQNFEEAGRVDHPKTLEAKFLNASYEDEGANTVKDELNVILKWRFEKELHDLNLRIEIRDPFGRALGAKLFTDIKGGKAGEVREEVFSVDVSPLQNGSYKTRYVFFHISSDHNGNVIDIVEGLDFQIIDPGRDEPLLWRKDWWGNFRLK